MAPKISLPTTGSQDLNLTPKQKEVFEFIQSYSQNEGTTPSLREIAQALGYSSVGTIQQYIAVLERKGYLKRIPGEVRGLKITSITREPEPPAHLLLPILGRVAAGRPIEVIETISAHTDTLDVPLSWLKRDATPSNHFVLQVTGYSMVDEGILDQDWVILKRQSTANNGDTIVALVDGEATIKKYYRRKNTLELHPANPAFQPIVVQSHQSFSIEGLLIGVMRKCQRI